MFAKENVRLKSLNTVLKEVNMFIGCISPPGVSDLGPFICPTVILVEVRNDS